MKVALAQINPIVGALGENAGKIRDIIRNYSQHSDLIIFPEMSITGYPPQDLLLDTAFLQKAQERLDELSADVTDTPVILGTIRQDGDSLYNTAAVLQKGSIIAFQDKTHLPTYDVFDEVRYFAPSESQNPVKVKIDSEEKKLGIQICEDLWDDEYDINVSNSLCEAGAEIIINISASPFHLNRLEERLEIIINKSKDLKCYFIYCNLVGAQDELVFDGQSCIVNPMGGLIALAPAFEEKVLISNLEKPRSVDIPQQEEQEQVCQALTLGVKDYFKKTGHSKAVVGLSGGIDSSVTAVIAQKALGSENVLGISMPSKFSSDHSVKDAEVLARNLNIPFQIIPIKEINEKMLSGLSPIFNGAEAGLAEENLQARIRGNILMAAANKQGALLLNTGNKTETALGYCTMYGDMAGALAVISDLNKSQVYALAHWINENWGKEIIPESTLTKPPSAELKPDQVDPFDYDVVSPLVDLLITEPNRFTRSELEGYDPELVQDLMKKIRLAEFKRRQAPPGIRVSPKAFGMGRRYPIVNKFSI